MKEVRVLMSVEHLLQSQLIEHALRKAPELKVVGQAHTVVDILHQIRVNQPDIWIHSWDQGTSLQAVLSHIDGLCSDLLVIRIAPDEEGGVAQIRVDSIDHLLDLACSRSLQPSIA